MVTALEPLKDVPDSPVPIVRALVVLAVIVPLAPKATETPLNVTLEFVSWEFEMPLSVPPSVKEPELVTVPVRVMPFTEPVPETLVTVPPKPVALIVIAAEPL